MITELRHLPTVNFSAIIKTNSSIERSVENECSVLDSDDYDDFGVLNKYVFVCIKQTHRTAEKE